MISLQLRQLARSYGHQLVFSKVTLNHQSGILGIAGPNGSGKSTLLKCIAGLLRPGNGAVVWKKGEQTLAQYELKSCLGYSAPYISLYKELTVRENLEFLARLRNIELKEEALAHLFELTELSQAVHQPFGRLSTGQQQRARLASSVFHNPSALLLDEPGTNLDKSGRKLVENMARIFGSKDKLLIIASNNDRELALCDRVFSVEQEAFI